jgi:hypothetical protein
VEKCGAQNSVDMCASFQQRQYVWQFKCRLSDYDLTALRVGEQVIEVGVPFTDPMADGTTIQRANEVIHKPCRQHVEASRDGQVAMIKF